MATIDFSFKSLISKAVGPIAFGVLVYVALSAWALSGHGELAVFAWGLFPVLLGLALANYLLRFLKWQYYLRTLEIALPARDSFVIFMSGLALSITPGKLGEVVRSYFLKRGFDEPVTRTAPIVLADRLSDLGALVLLSAIGAYSYGYGQLVVWSVAVLVGAVFVVVTVQPLGRRLFALLERMPALGRERIGHLERSYEAAGVLLDWRRILLPLGLSVMAWGAEAVGFWVTLHGFGLRQGVWAAVFIYAFSTIVGAVSMLPGGLGATEGTMTGLMKLLNIATGTAALAAIIIRAATLWFAVALGALFLLMAERRFGGGLKDKPTV